MRLTASGALDAVKSRAVDPIHALKILPVEYVAQDGRMNGEWLIYLKGSVRSLIEVLFGHLPEQTKETGSNLVRTAGTLPRFEPSPLRV
jgi:hypothetical protein